MFRKENLKYLIAILLMIVINQFSFVTMANDKENAESLIVSLQETLNSSVNEIEELKQELANIKDLVNNTYVTTNRIHVYSDKDSKSEKVGIYEKGTIITVEETDGKWSRTSDGYIYTGYIKHVNDSNGSKLQPIEKEEVKVETKARAVVATKAPRTFNIAATGRSGMNREDLLQVLQGYPLAKSVDKILEIETKYNTNAFLTLGIAKQETNWGKAGVGASRNNIFAMKGPKGYFRFKTIDASVDYFGDVMARLYFSNGKDTVEKIHNTYCPTDSTWGKNVKAHMHNVYKQLKK